MNTGTISSRYALALLRLVEETGRGEQVWAQVRTILADPDGMPKTLEPDLERFVALVVKNGRREYLKFMLQSFVSQYNAAHGIKLAHLTTAVPSPELESQLKGLFKDYRLIFDTKVNPDLIGGFVLVVDDLMMDASVKHQLDVIRKQFVEKNRRIV
ncbi:MAG: F0F1 ATP synthase subunit delta [Bacteroidales bacterium]|nr:F0F1 ATP synthase subunit delta [Bacteroidales bacterium]